MSDSVGLATAVATLRGLSTVYGTGGVTVGNVVGEGMTESSILCGNGFGKSTAVVTLSSLSAVLGTGCGVLVIDVSGKGVAKSSTLCYNAVRSAALAVTLSSLGAVLGTGSVFVVFVVGEGVTESCIGIYDNELRATAISTNGSAGAVSGTGCVIIVAVRTVIVSKCGDNGIELYVSAGIVLVDAGDVHEVELTSATLVVVAHTGCGTGFLLTDDQITVDVTELINVVVLVNVATVATGVGGVTHLITGRIGNLGRVVVLRLSRNYAVSESFLVAIDSYYLEAVFRAAEACIGSQANVIEGFERVSEVLTVAIYSVLLRTGNFIPGKQDLAALALCKCFCSNLDICFKNRIGFSLFRIYSNCNSARKCNEKHENSRERENFSE